MSSTDSTTSESTTNKSNITESTIDLLDEIDKLDKITTDVTAINLPSTTVTIQPDMNINTWRYIPGKNYTEEEIHILIGAKIKQLEKLVINNE